MNLKDLRKAKRMTCEDLATACGVSVYTIRAYEGGKRQMNADTLHQIAKALGVTMDEAYQAYDQRREKGGDQK